MAAVMKKSTHPRVPPPLTPPLCPLDLPFPWRPPWSNGPLPANGVVASILSYYETRSCPRKGCDHPISTTYYAYGPNDFQKRLSLLESCAEGKLRYFADMLESRGWIFENSLN